MQADIYGVWAIICKYFPSAQPVGEPPRWCNNCGSKDIVTVREFATAEEFIDAYNPAATTEEEGSNK